MVRLLPTVCLLFTLSLAACGRPPSVEVGSYAEYVQQFEQDSATAGAPVKVLDLRMETKAIGSGRMAACTTGENYQPTITVDPEVWGNISEIERKIVIHHELGHCVLNREHRDDETVEGFPVSLMNSQIIDLGLLVANEDYYLKELFVGESVEPNLTVFPTKFLKNK